LLNSPYLALVIPAPIFIGINSSRDPVYYFKSPFTFFVIPGLTRNPVFLNWIPAFAEILKVQFILHWDLFFGFP